MQTLQFEFLKYLNLARQHPAYFVSILDRQIAQFSQNDHQLPLAEDVYYETNEGKAAWIEARNFLLQQKPLDPLEHHIGLEESAKIHQLDLCKNKILGHIGSDNSTFHERILKICKKGSGAMAELIGADFQFPQRNVPEMTVLSLIVDDGIKDRGHRKTLFSNTYKYIGWSTGKQDEKIITIFNLTQKNLKIRSTAASTSTLSSLSQSRQKISERNVELTPQWNQEKVVFEDLSNISISNKDIQSKLKSRFQQNIAKNTKGSQIFKKQKINEKRQKSVIYYENGCKIMQTTTKYYYEDGRVEEYKQKRTLFEGSTSK